MTFVLLAIVFPPKEGMAAKEGSAERQRGGFVFTASVRNAAFLGRSPQGNQTILLVDYDTGKLKRIISPGAHLSSPRLSPDGTRLLLARQQFKERWQQLLSCNLHSFVCKSIVKSEGSIGSPVEITGGRVLYVSSPYDVGYDGRGRYALNDFWIVGQSGMPRQLTHMTLYQLNSVSVANGEVYFSAQGHRPQKPVLPKMDALAKSDSDIFKLKFDIGRETITVPPQTLTPLFSADGLASQPSISADGSQLAFLNTRTGIGTYRYDLVVVDMTLRTTRKIESRGLGFSRPSVVDENVYANDITDEHYLIKVLTPGTQDMALIASIDDASIKAAEHIEIRIEP